MPQKRNTSPVLQATGWEVWWRWTIASSVGLLIGLPIGYKLGPITHRWVYVLTGFYDPTTTFVLRAAVIGIVAGTTLGIGQRIVLSRVLPVAARRWIRMTVAGAVGGSIAAALVLVIAGALVGSRSYFLVLISFGWVLAPLCGGLLGAMIGLAQRFALPPFFPRGWWLAGNVAAWGSTVGIVTAAFLFLLSLHGGWDGEVGGPTAGEAIAGLAITLVVAAVANGALSSVPWLVFSRSASTSCLSCGYDLRGTADNICPECGRQSAGSGAMGLRRTGLLEMAMRVWRPGKGAIWSGTLGFLITFIGLMFFTEGGQMFLVLGISGDDVPRSIFWGLRALGAGAIVGLIACFIGGIVDKKRG